MKTRFLLLIVLTFMSSSILSQQVQDNIGIKFSGFIKNDFFYDTRQNVSIREGHFLLFPMNENLDANGKDLNAVPNFNFLSIQTRLTGKISGPDAFGGKTSGIIEADFFGNENASFVDANGFRLRHAVVKINWTSTELLTGQYWHPLFQPECFSGVISFNTGAPFQPFSRNPQIRITQSIGKLKISASLISQRDFTSPQGSTSMRNSAIPGSFAVLSYDNKSEQTQNSILIGIGGGYVILKPLLFTTNSGNKYQTDQTVKSLSSTAFLKYSNKSITLKLQGVYGQNLFDLTMLGGYAVSKVLDNNTNKVAYTPMNTASSWFEFMTNGEKIQFGLWAGYTQNLGASDSIAFYSNRVNGTDITIRGDDIHSLARVSPRVVFKSGKLNLALEMEYTLAKYATKDQSGNLNRNEKGIITTSKNIANIRGLFAVIYNF